MSHFYAEIEGSRGRVSRCGTKTSGHWGHVRGWNVGARVEANHDAKTGIDIIDIYPTGGSSGKSSYGRVAEFHEREDGKVVAVLLNPITGDTLGEFLL